MPIYEFYCRDCHTIFSFFARRVDTETVPKCPKHARHKLRRQMSRFAISSGRSDSPTGEGPEPDFDDEKMEAAMMHMAGEVEGMDEEDPRAMARCAAFSSHSSDDPMPCSEPGFAIISDRISSAGRPGDGLCSCT